MSNLVVQLLQAFVLLSHYVSDQERPRATRSDQDPEIEDDRRCLPMGSAPEKLNFVVLKGLFLEGFVFGGVESYTHL